MQNLWPQWRCSILSTLLLSAYQYKIEFIPGTSDKRTDCMSRLPSFSKRDSAEKVHAIMGIDELPVTASQAAKESNKDKHLAQDGRWPSNYLIISYPIIERLMNWQWLIDAQCGEDEWLFPIPFARCCWLSCMLTMLEWQGWNHWLEARFGGLGLMHILKRWLVSVMNVLW